MEKNINAQDRPLHLLTLSAKTEEALNELITPYLEYPFTDDLADIAYTANTGRAHFEHRLVVALNIQLKCFLNCKAMIISSAGLLQKPQKWPSLSVKRSL